MGRETAAELVAKERQKKEAERQAREQERQAKEKLAEYLRSMGIDPDQILQ